MKLHLFLLSIVCGLSQGNGEDNYYKEENWDYDDLNLVGLRENDKEIIYRPCNVRDLSCIRKFFAGNSKCSIAKGPAPDPLILERNTLYLPLVNTTVVINNVQISGLNDAKVIDFYVNKDTGNVVFAFNVYGLSERSTDTSFRYKRTGKEPIVLTDFTTVTYQEIRYTAVIPKVPNLQLDKADIHADITDSNPPFITGPNAYNSTDPDAITAYANLIVSLPTVLREAHLLKASLYVTVFIQYNICDFSQKIVGV